MFELKTWEMHYAEDITVMLNNKKILDNLRDGIPYPYSIEDAPLFHASA